MSQDENNPQNVLPLELEDNDYEVITSEEVDAVLDELDRLMQRVESDNIRVCLEEAADQIYALIYTDDEAEQESGAA